MCRWSINPVFSILSDEYSRTLSPLSFNWELENICFGTITYEFPAKWVPEYSIKNDYLQNKQLKIWKYNCLTEILNKSFFNHTRD